MKKIKLIALIFCVCLLSNSITAQENAVKLGLFDLVYGGLHLNFEHVLSDNKSVALNVTMLIPRKLPTFFFEEDVDDDVLDVRNKLSGFAITPEYRFYMSKNDAPRGFYIAPYARYSNYKVEFNDKFDGNNVDATGGISTIGGGLQFGTQWLISDSFVIDFYFLGIGVDAHNLSLEYSSDDDTLDYEQLANDIDTELSDASFIGTKVTTEHGDNFVKAKAPFVYPGFRGGLSIGYAF